MLEEIRRPCLNKDVVLGVSVEASLHQQHLSPFYYSIAALCAWAGGDFGGELGGAGDGQTDWASLLFPIVSTIARDGTRSREVLTGLNSRSVLFDGTIKSGHLRILRVLRVQVRLKLATFDLGQVLVDGPISRHVSVISFHVGGSACSRRVPWRRPTLPRRGARVRPHRVLGVPCLVGKVRSVPDGLALGTGRTACNMLATRTLREGRTVYRPLASSIVCGPLAGSTVWGHLARVLRRQPTLLRGHLAQVLQRQPTLIRPWEASLDGLRHVNNGSIERASGRTVVGIVLVPPSGDTAAVTTGAAQAISAGLVEIVLRLKITSFRTARLGYISTRFTPRPRSHRSPTQTRRRPPLASWEEATGAFFGFWWFTCWCFSFPGRHLLFPLVRRMARDGMRAR